MAIDLFLKIEGITGESRDARHKGEIDLLSFSWGEQESGHPTGGGGGGGKVSFQDLQFTSSVNKASPHLFLACASGRHFPKATLTARRAVGGQDFLKLTFQDVLVSSFHDGGAASSDAPVDQVSLNFGKVTFEYVAQRPDGKVDTPVIAGWNVVQNRSL